MRIAIAGASGTGKTTLANAICQKYGWPLNPIGARSVAASMGFSNPYDVDAAGRRVEFQQRLFEQKRDWEEAHESFVTDRSAVDNLAYCALHMPTDLPDNAVELYQSRMQRYDKVFFLPRASFQNLDDAVRVKNQAYQEIYEILLRGFIDEDESWNVTVIGEIEDRARCAFREIDTWRQAER